MSLENFQLFLVGFFEIHCRVYRYIYIHVCTRVLSKLLAIMHIEELTVQATGNVIHKAVMWSVLLFK